VHAQLELVSDGMGLSWKETEVLLHEEKRGFNFGKKVEKHRRFDDTYVAKKGVWVVKVERGDMRFVGGIQGRWQVLRLHHKMGASLGEKKLNKWTEWSVTGFLGPVNGD